MVAWIISLVPVGSRYHWEKRQYKIIDTVKLPCRFNLEPLRLSHLIKFSKRYNMSKLQREIFFFFLFNER